MLNQTAVTRCLTPALDTVMQRLRVAGHAFLYLCTPLVSIGPRSLCCYSPIAILQAHTSPGASSPSPHDIQSATYTSEALSHRRERPKLLMHGHHPRCSSSGFCLCFCGSLPFPSLAVAPSTVHVAQIHVCFQSNAPASSALVAAHPGRLALRDISWDILTATRASVSASPISQAGKVAFNFSA